MCICLFIIIYVCVYMCIYIYIYIYRERERYVYMYFSGDSLEQGYRKGGTQMNKSVPALGFPSGIFVCVQMYIYIYIYIERERDISLSLYITLYLSPSLSLSLLCLNMDSLRRSSVKNGTIQIRLAWPLRKDDTHKSKIVNNLLAPIFRREYMNMCFFYV